MKVPKRMGRRTFPRISSRGRPLDPPQSDTRDGQGRPLLLLLPESMLSRPPPTRPIRHAAQPDHPASEPDYHSTAPAHHNKPDYIASGQEPHNGQGYQNRAYYHKEPGYNATESEYQDGPDYRKEPDYHATTPLYHNKLGYNATEPGYHNGPDYRKEFDNYASQPDSTPNRLPTGYSSVLVYHNKPGYHNGPEYRKGVDYPASEPDYLDTGPDLHSNLSDYHQRDLDHPTTEPDYHVDLPDCFPGLPCLVNGTGLMSGPNGSSTASVEDDDELTDLRELYRIAVPILVTVCVLSLLFNLVILASARWVRRPLSPTLLLSLSLAVADAYASLVIGVGLVVNSLLPIVYGLDMGPYSSCYVLVLEAFRLGGMVVTVSHLLALAANHYIGILRPLHYAATVTRGLVAWATAAMWALPVLFFLAYFSLVPDDGFRSPHCSSYDFLLRVPFRATVSTLFFVPLLLMSVAYAHVFVLVRRHRRGLLRLPGAGRQQLHKNVKAVITTLLILGTYVAGWMPAVLFFVLTCLDCPLPVTQIRLRLRVHVAIAINCMIVVKSILDPVIYVVRMPEIKGALRAMLGTRCGLRPDGGGNARHSVRFRSETNRLTILEASSRRGRPEEKAGEMNGGQMQMPT